MKITFDILDSERDTIAASYGYNGSTDKDEFVLDLFKEFGRNCILSDEEGKVSVDLEQEKKDILETKKSTISF